VNYDIRKPLITAPTLEGQLLQAKSYLIQLVDQINFALNDLSKGNVSTSAAAVKSTETAGVNLGLESRFVAFQSQIVGGSVADTMTLGKRLTASDGAEIDLDNLRTPGCYYSPDGAYIESSPAVSGFRLEVKLAESDEKILQTAYYEGKTASRHFDGAAWSPWLLSAVSAEPKPIIVDFVTERGKADGWTYRKWASGIYEAFGSFEVTPVAPQINGTLYRTEDILIPVPFSIREDAVVSGTGADNYLLTNGAYASEGAISFRIVSDKEIGTTAPIKVLLHVCGTYIFKIGG
jgi:hypothetical protein